MSLIQPLISVGNNIVPAGPGQLVDPTALGSGTASSTTYLRGDSTWQTIATSSSIPSYTGSLNAGKSPLLALALGIPAKAVGNTVTVGANPDGVAYGANSIWVTNFSSNTVSRIS